MTSHTLDDSPSGAPDDATRHERSGRRGPHSLVTLAAFAGLVTGFMGLVVLLLTLARFLQRAL